MYQLCFDNQCAENINRDTELKQYLIFLRFNTLEENLIQNCSGILMLLKRCKTDLPVITSIINGRGDYDSSFKYDEKFNIITENCREPELMRLRQESIRPPIVIKELKPIIQLSSHKPKHIMISYNSKSKETCLKIRNELENIGFITWIDVQNISGSSLESMADAIENSHCVLMCMTEKYKQSPNCRLEAEYTVNLNKSIIPLILEKGYKPDGWLAIILGSKIFIDFTKYSFEESFNRLMKEIDYLIKIGKISKGGSPKVEQKNLKSVLKASDPALQTNNAPQTSVGSFPNKVPNPTSLGNIIPNLFMPAKAPSAPKLSNVQNWSENDVNEWIKEKRFDKNIIKAVYPCNGEHLLRMHEMYQKIPEFFYNSLNSSKNVYLKDLVHFSNELIKLFT